MFQVKISAAIIVVVVALMGFAYVAFTSNVTEGIVYSEHASVEASARSVQNVARTSELALIARSQTLASNSKFIAELGDLSTEEINAEMLRNPSNRLKLFEFLLEWKTEYANRLEQMLPSLDVDDPGQLHQANLTRPLADWFGSTPELLLAFQYAHIVVAHAEKGTHAALEARKYSQDLPFLVRACGSECEGGEGEPSPQVDVIAWNSYRYFAVANPTFSGSGSDTKFIGNVVMGFQLGTEFVNRLGAHLDESTEVVLSLTAPNGDRTRIPKTNLSDGLSEAEFAPVDVDTDNHTGLINEDAAVTFDDMESGKVYGTTIDGGQYLVTRIDWLYSPNGKPHTSFYVLTNLSQALGPVEELQYQIPFVGVLILLIALFVVMFIIRKFLNPLEEIDVGIQEILAGDKDHIFRAKSGDNIHSELANSLNQVVAFLQGRKPPGEEEAEWDQLLVDLEPERPSIYGMQAIQPSQPDTDPEEKAALQDLYDLYMGKRKELDQHVDMDFDRFVRRIKRNEKKLIEKHGCTAVEFSVTVNDGKVVLKPTPIFE